MTNPNITHIEYVDYGVNGEFDFFGKVVAKSDVTGKTPVEIEAEIIAMHAILGDHVVAIPVELVGAVA